MRRFEQEARAAAALKHPNILAVYQMATHEGASYMVTELLEGETLRERLIHGAMGKAVNGTLGGGCSPLTNVFSRPGGDTDADTPVPKKANGDFFPTVQILASVTLSDFTFPHKAALSA